MGIVKVVILLGACLAAVVVLSGVRRGLYRVGAGTQSPDPRLLIVSGSYGAGHDAAAREIACELESAGILTETLDVVELFPWGIGRVLRAAYIVQLKIFPRSWGWLLLALSTSDGRDSARGGGAALRFIAWLPAARLQRHLDTAVSGVVSTHPFASAALGRLRLRGELEVPVATYLTDASVHAMWVHPGVDQHLAIYPEAERQAVAHGARGVRLLRPAGPRPRARLTATERCEVLRRMAIPTGRPVALVVGGSEGVGELLGSAVDVAGTGLVTTVVACGRNEHLRVRLTGRADVLALGWVDGLDDLLGAVDCVVQNSGGFTVLEARASGTPVISYRPLPGHGVASAAALARDRLAPWPMGPAALADAITDALTEASVSRPETGAPTGGSGAAPTVREVLCPRHLLTPLSAVVQPE